MILSKYKPIIFSILFIVACILAIMGIWYHNYSNKLAKMFDNFAIKPVAIYIKKNDRNYEDLYIEFTSNIDLDNSEKTFVSMDCIIDDRQSNANLTNEDFRLLDNVVPTDVELIKEKSTENDFFYQAELIMALKDDMTFYNNSISCKARFDTLVGKKFMSNVIKFDTSGLAIKR